MRLHALRHAWPVRWAHHPLCARHRHETWRIGRLHLCRGCSSLLGGSIVALPLLSVAPPQASAACLLLLAPVLLLSWPPLYRRLPRSIRDVLRFSTGALVVAAAWCTCLYPTRAWPLLPLLFVTWRLFVRARARVMARRCDGCPELGAGRVCSGYVLQAQCQRALEASVEAELGDALSGHGPPPSQIDLPRRTAHTPRRTRPCP